MAKIKGKILLGILAFFHLGTFLLPLSVKVIPRILMFTESTKWLKILILNENVAANVIDYYAESICFCLKTLFSFLYSYCHIL